MESRWQNGPDRDGDERPEGRTPSHRRTVPLQRNSSASGTPSIVRAPADSPASRRRSDDTPPCSPGRDDLTPGSSGRERGSTGAAPWAVLAPGNATTVDLRHRSVRAGVRAVGRLGPGGWVVLLDEGPMSRARLRRIAHGGGLLVVRELIVVPSIEEPTYVADAVEWAERRRSLRPAGGLWSVNGILRSGRILIARRA